MHGAAAVLPTPTGPPLADGWVLIADGRVQATGSGRPPRARNKLDVRGCLVLPGLVCAHHHLFQGASRGVPTTGGLTGWLLTHYPRWTDMSANDVSAAAELSIAQLLVRGATTVAALEFLHPAGEDFVSPVVAAAERLGIRLRYVRGTTTVLEPGISDELTRRGVDCARLVEPPDLALARIRETISAPTHDRLRWACGPTTPVLDDGGEFQRQLNRVAEEADVPIHLHYHPLPPAGESIVDGFALADELGLVRRGNWFAHGSRLCPDDVARLGTAGVGVVHCPSASMRLRYPLPELADWRDRNPRVAVGVDGAASNDRGSLLGEAQLAAYTQGQPHLTGRIGAADALDLVTAAAARTIGWPGAGTLTPGSLGDVAVFDLNDLDSAGATADPDRALVRLFRTYSGARARWVLVGGEPVVADGLLRRGDEKQIAAAANSAAQRLYTVDRSLIAAEVE
ncbi:amidohydrolase family protein [Actinophytocola sp.]|uniref:amidohydrolase family protein n=1 Tax=Actinophytocola sp. TaxID=1872138 RepID=UPI003D6B2F72